MTMSNKPSPNGPSC